MAELNQTAGISVPPVARAGDPLDAIDTPSLILDLDVFEDNLRTMQVLAERHGVALRPHAKAHKCPDVALRQIALGAVGICCQKVSEAVPFVQAGVRDVHISNEVLGTPKLALLARLAGQASMTVCVDHARALEALGAAVQAQGVRLGVLVEIDVGQKRCGVQNPADAVALARRVLGTPGLEFMGLQAYHGGLQHKRSLMLRQRACHRAARRVKKFLAAFARAGIECRRVTGGGTGSAEFDVACGVYTEIQAGSYPFMDAQYASIDWDDSLSFKHSLFLMGTVMSAPRPDRVVVDVGLKSTSAECGVPRALPGAHWRCVAINDEHTILHASRAGVLPALGARVRLIPSHVDPTFNLHDAVVAVRGQKVEAVWPISARGLSR
ncbi:MAG TPA: DSD1 family PLP-dependent enzyme [Burkholderiaceae bacterium]|nr:DSD1 family PLP-dependent enzyme [Burkholderiaceae bacterium]